MGNETNSGQQVINEFMASLSQLDNTDERVIQVFVSLHEQGKLTDTNLHNALDQMIIDQMKDEEQKDVED